MRLIGSLPNEFMARRFSEFLQHKGILHSCDGNLSTADGHITYQIWVHEEDQIPEAITWLSRFQDNSKDPEFQVELPPVAAAPQKKQAAKPRSFHAPFTMAILALCSLIFLLDNLEKNPKNLSITPIESLLLYDLPPAGAPLWHGFYTLITEPKVPEGPLFTKIKEGEIWRLFTPALLHRDLLHILFNMLWLWVLGRPIEQRIGTLKMFLFTLIIAAISNTAQYLMGGPFFLGYSGVIMGQAGFIWSRLRLAPWEGYPVQNNTLYFLFLFIAGMVALQLVSLLIQNFTALDLPLNIANSAHIAGGLAGLFLGRLPFFAWRRT